MTFTLGVSEDDLQKQVAEYLAATLPSGCVFHHSPNEGRRHINFINKLKRMGTKYGWPDLEIFCPGSATKSGMNEAIFIELKVKRGTMNENQRRMRDAIIDAGFAWALCRSLADVDAFLDPLIKLKVSR